MITCKLLICLSTKKPQNRQNIERRMATVQPIGPLMIVEQSFQIALNRLERQILRSKELEFDTQFAHPPFERLGVFKEQLWGGE